MASYFDQASAAFSSAVDGAQKGAQQAKLQYDIRQLEDTKRKALNAFGAAVYAMIRNNVEKTGVPTTDAILNDYTLAHSAITDIECRIDLKREEIKAVNASATPEEQAATSAPPPPPPPYQAAVNALAYQQYVDPATGAPYWHNAQTGDTRWTAP